MKTTKKQQLRSSNLMAAKTIYKVLKEEKVLNAKQFKNTFFGVRQDLPSYGYFKNWETTIQFLLDHEIMTTEIINGFRFYFATQKCVRTKNFENATIEYEYVEEWKIDEAIVYQKINSGKVDPFVEGMVIATNLFKLSPELSKRYATSYKQFFIMYKTKIENKELVFFNRIPEMKYAVLGPFGELKELRKR